MYSSLRSEINRSNWAIVAQESSRTNRFSQRHTEAAFEPMTRSRNPTGPKGQPLWPSSSNMQEDSPKARHRILTKSQRARAPAEQIAPKFKSIGPVLWPCARVERQDARHRLKRDAFVRNVSERQSGECSSGESKATRTSVREPQLEPEMRRQNPAQRRQLSSFVRTTKLVKSSDRPRLLRARAWHCRADRPKARLPPRRSRWNRDRLQL